MNSFHVTGNLTKDPKYSKSKSGVTMLEGSIADNSWYKGEKKTSFWDFIIFGKQADYFHPILHKGSPVYLGGNIEQQRWEFEGKQYSKVVILVNNAQAGRQVIGETHEEQAPMGIDEIPF